MKTLKLLAASALLLSACASTGSRDGLVYRDGSWYSPAGDGRGDYYTASSRKPDAWDDPYWFGVGIVPYGGYCPVRYRYCTSFWADPFYGGVYDPFYDPLWWYYRPPPRRHHPPPNPQPLSGLPPDADRGMPPPNPRAPAARPEPRPWEERPMPAGRPADSDESPRPRRRGSASGGGLG